MSSPHDRQPSPLSPFEEQRGVGLLEESFRFFELEDRQLARSGPTVLLGFCLRPTEARLYPNVPPYSDAAWSAPLG